MFTVEIITNIGIQEEGEEIPKGTVIYEEIFDNLNQINMDEFLGGNYTIKIINNENNSILTIEK